MKVLVAMSGGLDSAVAALRMVEEGHDVTGVFMRLWDPLGGHGSRCCSLEDMEDARRVAERLGIPLLEECTSRRFFDEIFMPSLERYADGLTPNPCVVCNERIKFAELEAVAERIGAELLVTGHYARCEADGDGGYRLLRGADRAKDQSYFLHRLGQERLRRVCFPVGGLAKAEVRRMAVAAGLPVARKPESQELCFVPRGTSYGELLEGWLPDRVRPGEVVDRGGRRLGEHAGVHRYTVGQRRGLGVAAAHPVYVLALHPESGRVVVGGRDELLTRSFAVREVVWVASSPQASPLRCTVQVRSHHAGHPAEVAVDGDAAAVGLGDEIPAPAPGQAAVFYRGDEVLGGGWITAWGG